MSIRPSLPLAGLLLAVSLPLSAAQPGTTKGAPLSGCAAKQAAIEAKLETARSFANEARWPAWKRPSPRSRSTAPKPAC